MWDALDALTEPLRSAVVLRYFSTATSYESIAAALGVPVGTVRSRLNQARRVLVAGIQDLARSAHTDHHDVENDRASLIAGITEQYNRGLDLDLLRTVLSPHARLSTGAATDVIVGKEAIVRGLGEDIEAGVRLRLLNVVAGRDITIVEGAFDNPPGCKT